MTQANQQQPSEQEVAKVPCPMCRATDNSGYIDTRGFPMRACGRCMLTWQDRCAAPTSSIAAAAERSAMDTVVGTAKVMAEISAAQSADQKALIAELVEALEHVNKGWHDETGCVDCQKLRDVLARAKESL